MKAIFRIMSIVLPTYVGCIAGYVMGRDMTLPWYICVPLVVGWLLCVVAQFAPWPDGTRD